MRLSNSGTPSHSLSTESLFLGNLIHNLSKRIESEKTAKGLPNCFHRTQSGTCTHNRNNIKKSQGSLRERIDFPRQAKGSQSRFVSNEVGLLEVRYRPSVEWDSGIRSSEYNSPVAPQKTENSWSALLSKPGKNSEWIPFACDLMPWSNGFMPKGSALFMISLAETFCLKRLKANPIYAQTTRTRESVSDPSWEWEETESNQSTTKGVTRGTLTIFLFPTSLHQCTHYLDAFEFKQYFQEESHTATTIPTAIDSHPNEWNKRV